jgi:ATP-binding cassette subfamily B protein
VFKLFKKATKKDMLFLLLAVAFIVLQVALELKMPDYMSSITKLVETPNSIINDILKYGGYMIGCALGALAANVISGYILANFAASLSKNIRKSLFDKVEDMDMSQIKEFSTSSLVTRSTNDITQIQMFLAMGLRLIIRAPITAIWAITKIANKSWQWSTATAVGVLILLIGVSILMTVVVPRFKIVQKLIDRLNEVTRENLTGIRVVRAFNAEKYQEDKFEKANTDLTDMQLFIQRTFAMLSPGMSLIMYFLTLSIYIIGASLINQVGMMDKITVFSDMVVFSSYAMQIIISFLLLAMMFMMWPRASVSAGRINEVLDKEATIKDGKVDHDITGKKGEVEFKNVTFKYPDAEEEVLENISFNANKGETIAFIGSTGSGKSTLINLVPRFYDATSGEVLVDGVNVKDYTQEYLHSKLGYIPQRAVIFNDTVANNITYGDDLKGPISEEDMKKAIEVAQAKDFVEKMEHGYDEEMARDGTNVSGGQKQRLSIARAIARKPEIYIFDDTFSALDYKTDSVLRKALKEYTKDATILIVAQRIGTIMNADKIIVLDEGKIVGMGKHKDLLKNCEVYKQIALSQLSKEELENA